jgi:DNA-binding NarL/FixJ family response regulator
MLAEKEGRVMHACSSGAPTIGIVTDQKSLSDGFVLFLKDDPALEVAHAVGSSNVEIEQLRQSVPTIVVIDQSLPNGKALDIALSIHEARPETRVVFLMTSVSDIGLRAALEAGCDGVLCTQDSIADLVASLKQIASGQRSFSQQVQHRLRFDDGQCKCSIHVDSPLGALTSRQLEILRHLACGDSVKDVARKLHLSPKSVDNHKYRIMNKVGVRDRVHLARYAIREGLIEA